MAEALSNVGLLKFLLGLPDTRELGSVALLALAKDARTESLQPGDRLSADQHVGRRLYLVDGEIELVADEQVLQVIQSGSERANQPLFRIHTHGLQAHCLKSCRLLSLNEQTLENYQQNNVVLETPSGFNDIVDKDDETIIEEIHQSFFHQEVDLPSIPDIALKINQAVQDESLGFEQIANLVQADPMISARVVQVANSAMYAASQPVQTIRRAVQRLGLRAMRTIVMSVALRNLYTPASPLIKKRMLKYYHHSVRIGVISHVLAKQIKGFDPEQAFLAGLMHDIGLVPILIRADQHPDIRDNAELLDKIIDDIETRVAGMLLKQWGFEEALITVAENAENWQRDVIVADYCDIVQLAHLHCDMLGGDKPEMPALEQLPAWQRLDLNDTNPLLIVTQAKQEMNELIHLLD